MKPLSKLIVLIPLFLFLSSNSFSQNSENKKILILISYHQGFTWSDDVIIGINNGLKKIANDIQIYIEYMDTRRWYDDKLYESKLFDIYSYKYRNIKFDLIISIDDNAYHFLLKNRNQLFNDSPVVFSGVNFFSDDQLTGKINFTGITESLDIKGSIDLMIQVLPHLKEIKIISDKSSFGRMQTQIIEKELGATQKDISIEILDNLSINDFKELATHLERDSAILYVVMVKDRNGVPFNPSEYLPQIANNSKVPIFGVDENLLPFGIIGGSLKSGVIHGNEVAEIAKEVLAGKPVSNIPIIKKSKFVSKLQYDILKRFKIEFEHLPKHVIIIGKPFSFYENYKQFVLTVSVIITVLLISITILTINTIRKKKVELTLREEKEFSEKLIISMQDGLSILDPDGIHVDVNPSFTNMTGFTKEELIGVGPPHPYWPPEEYENIEKAFIKSQEGKFEELELIFMRKNGQRFPVIVSPSRIKDNHDNTIRYFASVKDISQRKLAEDILREKKEAIEYERNLLQDVMNGAKDIHLVYLDRDFNFIRVNKTYASTCGYRPEEMIGKNHFALYPDPGNEAIFTRVRDTGIPFSIKDKPFSFPDQPERGVTYWDWSLIPIKDLNNAVTGLIFSLVETTERKQAEEALRLSSERFIKVLDSIDATVYVSDMKTYEILFMNENMIKHFGRDMTGELCWKVFRGESGPCSHCTNEKLVDEAGQPTGVCIWQDINPITGKWHINYDRAIEWIDGRIVRIQIATDISEMKKLESQLQQTQKMESVGRLAGGVAHDFNNMLGVIIGHCELALERVDPASPVHADLKVIMNAVLHSADLTRQLLAFARKQIALPKVLDLNDSVSGMLKMLERLIGEDIDLLWRPGHGLWPVKIDPSQMDQVLANLCVNARDAIAGVGMVTIETENTTLDEAYCSLHEGAVPGDYVMLAVSDNGHGMDKETLENCFEPFYTTKEVGQGTGMGLATVFGIVKQNDGFIYAYSEPDHGTTFKIYLPRTTEPAAKEAEPPTGEIPRGTETVLVVEDEPAILKMGTIILERYGYTVLAANNPSEAMAIAEKHEGPIHLLLTDVVMPEMNGKDLKAHIEEFRPDIKVLYISGYTADIIVQRGILEREVNFLQKPFSISSLAGKVRFVLDREKKNG